MRTSIQTVLGTLPLAELGRTLVHEHILVKYPGAEFDPKSVIDREGVIVEAVRRLTELREVHGVRTFVDPCPVELGRDVALLAEVSERSQVHIVCTTGFYFESMGLPPYWRNSSVEQIAEFYLTEIEQGAMRTSVRAGALKCATSGPRITEGERKCLAAASIAHKATGVPIITHTQGGLGGPEQQDLFQEHGVPLQRALIGHCCESTDHAYHRRIVDRGSYIGFDRIGWEQFQSDAARADSLVRLYRAGKGDQILLSQDRYCAMIGRYGRHQSQQELAAMEEAKQQGQWPPPFTQLFTKFIPMLIDRGMTRAEIDAILDVNPMRFFSGAPLPAAAVQAA